MSIVRVGSNEKYSQGWNQIFGKKKSVKRSKTKQTGVKSTKRKKKAS